MLNMFWKSSIVSLHTTEDTHLLLAVGAAVDHVFESINTEWDQATTEPTTR